MPVKIRLMRIGAKKRPFYRVVAVDERKKRTGEYLDLLGTYNPLTEPKEIILKQDKIDEWIKKGAILSDGYLRMTKQAPQRPPRKPKKQAKEEKTESPQVTPKSSETEAIEESAKSETDKASGAVEHKEEEEIAENDGAKQASSEPTGRASDALQSDELTKTEQKSEEDK